MTFIASKIFWWIAAPGNLMLLFLTLGVTLGALNRARRLSRGLIVTAMAMGLAIAVTPLRAWMLAPLEARFPAPVSAPDKVDGVIVLGGGIDSILSQAWGGEPALTAAGDRIVEMARLAKRYPEARMVFSGGSASIFDDSAREADYVKRIMADLGLDGPRFVYERESRNTFENAANSKDMIKPQPGETWLLVTSAYHMPRSVGIFRKLGWNVTAWPVDYGLPPGGGGAAMSFFDGLEGVHWASREWMGLAFYYAAGRTSALFPAP